MAKKAVATLHEGSTDGRAYSKVIKMVKSPKTGAYVFESDCEKELVYVHKTTYNEQIFPNAQELNGGRFWTKTEIENNLGKDIFTPNFESEYKRFFHKEE